MAIREKLRAKFRSKKTQSEGSSDGSIPGHYTGRKDIEYYKPHEIPKSKYKGKVDPAHQESLEAYSFGGAFQTVRRRASVALSGTFSPGGTKALSAAPSAVQSRRPSWQSRRQSSISSISAQSGDDDSRGKSLPQPPTVDNISEHSGEDTDADSPDASLSRSRTAKEVFSSTDGSTDLPSIRLDRLATVTDDKHNLDSAKTPINNIPFTVEELERAMTKATLHSPRRVSVFA